MATGAVMTHLIIHHKLLLGQASVNRELVLPWEITSTRLQALVTCCYKGL